MASEGDVAAVEGLESAMGVVERVVFAAWRVDEVLRRVQGEEMDWDGVREEGSVVGMVWKGVSKSLRERLSAALSKSAGLRGALASRAPKGEWCSVARRHAVRGKGTSREF